MLFFAHQITLFSLFSRNSSETVYWLLHAPLIMYHIWNIALVEETAIFPHKNLAENCRSTGK